MFSEAAPASSDPLADFKRERLKYKALRKEQGKKGSDREDLTLSILNKFKSKLEGTRKVASSYSDDEDKEEDNEDEVTDLSWCVCISNLSVHMSVCLCCLLG